MIIAKKIQHQNKDVGGYFGQSGQQRRDCVLVILELLQAVAVLLPIYAKRNNDTAAHNLLIYRRGDDLCIGGYPRMGK